MIDGRGGSAPKAAECADRAASAGGAVRRLAGLMMLVMATAQAADPAAQSTSQEQWPGYEVAPFAGLSLGGGFSLQDGAVTSAIAQHVDLDDRASFAVALDLRANDSAQYELFYGRESTVLRGEAPFASTPVVLEYLHLGGLLRLSDELPIRPYIVAGLGLTRFSPNAPGSSDTRFSASAGLGLRWPVNQHLALRLEARGLATLVSGDTAIFCRSDQSGLLCHVHGRGQGFYQGMLLAGAAINF